MEVRSDAEMIILQEKSTAMDDKSLSVKLRSDDGGVELAAGTPHLDRRHTLTDAFFPLSALSKDPDSAGGRKLV